MKQIKWVLALFALLLPAICALAQESEQWEFIGQSTLTTEFPQLIYNDNAHTFHVRTEKSTTRPGVYRLIDPFGQIPAKNGVTRNVDPKNPPVMLVHIENDDAIWFESFNTGLEQQGKEITFGCTASDDMLVENKALGELAERVLGYYDGNYWRFYTGTAEQNPRPATYFDTVDGVIGCYKQYGFTLALPSENQIVDVIDARTFGDSGNVTPGYISNENGNYGINSKAKYHLKYYMNTVAEAPNKYVTVNSDGTFTIPYLTHLISTEPGGMLKRITIVLADGSTRMLDCYSNETISFDKKTQYLSGRITKLNSYDGYPYDSSPVHSVGQVVEDYMLMAPSGADLKIKSVEIEWDFNKGKLKTPTATRAANPVVYPSTNIYLASQDWGATTSYSLDGGVETTLDPNEFINLPVGRHSLRVIASRPYSLPSDTIINYVVLSEPETITDRILLPSGSVQGLSGAQYDIRPSYYLQTCQHFSGDRRGFIFKTMPYEIKEIRLYHAPVEYYPEDDELTMGFVARTKEGLTEWPDRVWSGMTRIAEISADRVDYDINTRGFSTFQFFDAPEYLIVTPDVLCDAFLTKIEVDWIVAHRCEPPVVTTGEREFEQGTPIFFDCLTDGVQYNITVNGADVEYSPENGLCLPAGDSVKVAVYTSKEGMADSETVEYVFNVIAKMEPVSTPYGSSLSGTGSSNGPRWAPADIQCDTEGAVIRYEIFESENFTTPSPEVTEESPILDPENPQPWINCTPGKRYGIVARAFKEGMLPSAKKRGWDMTIYTETTSLKELADLPLPDGVANKSFPISYVGEALVTRFKDFKANSNRTSYDYNYLYIQDEDYGIAIQYYDGDLKPGDKITNLCLVRNYDSRDNLSFSFYRKSTSNYDPTLRYEPVLTGHVDELPYKEITPSEAKDQFPYCLVKIKGIEDADYSGQYFQMKHNGKWIPKATLRGYHDDPALREGYYLESESMYEIMGLTDVSNGYNTFLLFTGSIKCVKKPHVATPQSLSSSVVVAANHPVYLVCEQADAKIYYTLDGSEPTEESTLYTGPFILPKVPEVTVRYKAFADGYAPVEGTPCTYERNGLLCANFEFSNPSSLGLPELGDEEEKPLDGALPLKVTVEGCGEVALTLTPPEGTHLQLRRDKEGQTALEIPEGTKAMVESGYAISGLRYRYDSYSDARHAFSAADATLNGSDESCGWNISHDAEAQYSIEFVSSLVGDEQINPVLESMYVYIDPKQAMVARTVEFDRTELALIKGEQAVLEALVGPELAVDKVINWESSDRTVAAVNNEGVVKALKSGSAVISAYVVNNPAAKAQCVLTVTTPAEGIKLSHEEKTLIKGETFLLEATVLPKDADDKSMTWSSSDETVATVADGLVSAVGVGSARITVSDVEEHTAVCEVTVTDLMGTSLTTSEGSATIDGRTITIKGFSGSVFKLYNSYGVVVDMFTAEGAVTEYHTNVAQGVYILASDANIPIIKAYIR